MNKTIFLLVCLLGISLSLKISHLQDSNVSPSTSTSTETPKPPAKPLSPAQQAANGRLMQFVFSDPELTAVLMSKGTPSPAQLQKLMTFMINDRFFRMKMINDISSKPENRWMKTLSLGAQTRYLKIITKVPFDKLDDQQTMKNVVSELYADKEIGKALRKQYGNTLPTDLLKNSQSSLQSGATAAHHMVASARL